MAWGTFKPVKYCRWCGNQYYAKKPVDRAGFCKPACKQAHWRAYKKYVTAKRLAEPGRYPQPVTQKKTRQKAG